LIKNRNFQKKYYTLLVASVRCKDNLNFLTEIVYIVSFVKCVAQFSGIFQCFNPRTPSSYKFVIWSIMVKIIISSSRRNFRVEKMVLKFKKNFRKISGFPTLAEIRLPSVIIFSSSVFIFFNFDHFFLHIILCIFGLLKINFFCWDCRF